MSIKEALNLAIQKLKKTSFSPALDAEILLSFVLKKNKEYLFTYPEKNLTLSQVKKFKKLVSRRTTREPISYITGHKEFFGLDFFIDKNVLIPRPETEMMIVETRSIIEKHCNTSLRQNKNINIIDIGTGSGAIIIALAKNIPNAKFYAADISSGALNIAKKNARKHRVASKINFSKGNLLEPLKNILSRIKGEIIITANLPYVPTKIWQKIMPDVKNFEPRIALDGGSDGLFYYNKLFTQINSFFIKTPLTIFLEIDSSQSKTTPALVKRYFPKAKIQIKKDLSNRERLIIVRLNTPHPSPPQLSAPKYFRH